MKKCSTKILLYTVISIASFALPSFPADMLQPRMLIDAPTAGVLPKGSFDFASRFYPAGDPSLGTGMIMGFDVGLTDRFSIGLSYGGEGLVGRKKNARFNYLPGWLIKYRLFEEDYIMPAMAIGYDHQGYGGMTDSADFGYKGYIYKSPGFFLALSKNYLLFTRVQFGIHGSVNFSMEELNNVKWPNASAGIDIGLNEELALLCEYNFGLNTRDPVEDRTPVYARPSEGYLNAGVRWAFSPSFFAEFDAKDLLENRRDLHKTRVGWTREIKLVYISSF